MRLLPLFFFLAGTLFAEEPAPTFPLWDGVESVADYAKKTDLPPTKTLDLGNGVELELVLIPAGKFVMGMPKPMPVDEDGFDQKIVTAQAGLVTSGGALLILSGFAVVRAIRKKRRLQVSLDLLLLVTVASGGCVLSGLHWWQSEKGLQTARLEEAAAEARFKSAPASGKPAHLVTLTRPFYMGKYNVTYEQYKQVVEDFQRRFIDKNCPIGRVTWDEARSFCKKSSERTKQTVRLPTEAEWEYSCRAGTTTSYHSGEAEADLARVAWYSANSNGTVHPVGQKEPNTFGLHDMHGNVYQWCQSRYENYAEYPEVDPPGGPPPSSSRIMRGSAYFSIPIFCRSDYRSCAEQDTSVDEVSFRVVMPAVRTP